VSTAKYLIGDTRAVVATLPDASVDLVLTSPPFLALRSYLDADDPNKALEIGQEANPAAFLDVLLELTAGWRRVLAPHGSIAIELGDTYSGGWVGESTPLDDRANSEGGPRLQDRRRTSHTSRNKLRDSNTRGWPLPKSLALVPELYRIALAYGINPLTGATSPAGRWRVRNVVRWHRPNPPVGALGDKYRPSTSDMVIACVSDRRWFDLDAVRSGEQTKAGGTTTIGDRGSHDEAKRNRITNTGSHEAGAPPLDTWVIPTHPYPGSHYATWPPALCVKPIKSMCPEKVCRVCGEPSRRIVDHQRTFNDGWREDAPSAGRSGAAQQGGPLAHWSEYTVTRETLGWTDCGCSTDGTHWRPGVVLDPFGGSGTTGAVATGLGRDAILVDLDARNADLARERIGMFMEAS
jgi:site-specific DNA-methyltransferase (adenine-specific)